jgi:hypothetical protein
MTIWNWSQPTKLSFMVCSSNPIDTYQGSRMTPLFCADGGWEDDLEKRELRLFQAFLASFTDRCPPHEFFNYPSMATL